MKEWTDAEYQAELEHIEKVNHTTMGHFRWFGSLQSALQRNGRSRVLLIIVTLFKANNFVMITIVLPFPRVFRSLRSLCSGKEGSFESRISQVKLPTWLEMASNLGLKCEASEASPSLSVTLPQVFSKLVEKCKRLNRAMRIGTNHGSLSDRILNYYGDTPRGMVESAFEYARIARKMDYHNFLFSMKASNPVVMVEVRFDWRSSWRRA